MIMEIYKKALSVLMKKPLRLWGITLLCILLTGVGSALFGIIPGIGLCISLLLETAMTIIFLRGYRGEEVNTLQLFDCFKDWNTIKRVLCGMGWMTLWIFLWGLIPVVGPIFALIRTYEYRLTPYILVMEPDVKPSDAIKLSKVRTMGWKGKMFGADILVAVGFYLVTLVLLLFSHIRYIGVLFGLVNVLFVICFIVLAPLFLGLVQAAFYEEICGKASESAAQEAQAAPVAEIPTEPQVTEDSAEDNGENA